MTRENPTIRTDITDALRRAMARLGLPGSWHTGAHRIAIAGEFRRARAGLDAAADLPPGSLEAGRAVAVDAAEIDQDRVDHFASIGLPLHGYVEVVGVVSRIAAVDAFHRALGYEAPPFPDPTPGPPTGLFDQTAKPSKGFVPMLRGTSIWWALTLVPEAYEGMEELHSILYLSPHEMREPGSPRALSRPAMELIASRASAINECFY